MNDDKYMLVLELRPNDFMPISINVLVNNNGVSFDTIEGIDSFTSGYTEKEIIEMIKYENIVPLEYLNGELKVINNRRYRFKLLTKEINFSLENFVSGNINDKIVMNRFINIVCKYDKLYFNDMKYAVKNRDVMGIFNVFAKYSYLIQRNIYFYLYENFEK